MVAVIKFSVSLANVLNYNENKLKQEVPVKDTSEPRKMKAELIHSSGFAKDTEKLGYTDKFRHIKKQMNLRESRKKSVVHISLNFDPSEQLTRYQLQQIADVYMRKIGFEKQPYLVYQHFDAGHPHVHIVSTIIKNNGDLIETNNIGRLVSEPARKEIENLFGLVKADGRKIQESFQLEPINAQKIQYGKSQTKRAITNVLDFVLFNYKYTSLNELNAVLKYYNLHADSGAEKSRINRNKGLVYRVLDEHGNKIGVPIKASDLHNKPGLRFLEQQYPKNESLRQPFKARIKNAIDLSLARKTTNSIDDLQMALQKDKVQLVVRQNQDGKVYGLTFIDHQSKSVFNGSDLGKNYSAAAVVDRLNKPAVQVITQSKQDIENRPVQPRKASLVPGASKQKILQSVKGSVGTGEIRHSESGRNMLAALTKPEYAPDTIPSELKQKKKRKKRRIHL